MDKMFPQVDEEKLLKEEKLAHASKPNLASRTLVHGPVSQVGMVKWRTDISGKKNSGQLFS